MSNDVYIFTIESFTVCVPLSRGDHSTPNAFIVVRARCSADQLPADLPNNGEFQCLKETPFLTKAEVYKKNISIKLWKWLEKTKKLLSTSTVTTLFVFYTLKDKFSWSFFFFEKSRHNRHFFCIKVIFSS